MESPGEYLRRERELRGVSLEEIHRATRVPMRILEALEADRYDELPHQAFVKGYIKAYCKHIGLDETDTILRYEMYQREVSLKVMPADREEAKVRRTPSVLESRNLVAGLVVLGVVMIVLFYVFTRGPGGHAPVVTGPVKEAPEKAVREVPEEKAAMAPENPPAAPEKVPAVTEAAPSGHVLTVTASEDVWIEAAIDDGEPFDVLLRDGESVRWEAAGRIRLKIGNAAGAALTFDGRRLPPLGEHGEVVRITLPASAGE